MKVALPLEPLERAGAGLSEVISGIVVLSVFSASMHLLAAYRATRPDVTRFIEAKTDARA